MSIPEESSAFQKRGENDIGSSSSSSLFSSLTSSSSQFNRSDSLNSFDLRQRCLMAVPKKGRLYDRSIRLLEGSGLDFFRHPRTDVAHCRNIALTIIFLNAADIAKFVGEGNVDIGIVGLDHLEEEEAAVKRLMPLNFGKCSLSLLAPEGKYKHPIDLVGKKIVTSFPNLTRRYFERLASQLQKEEDNWQTTNLHQPVCSTEKTRKTHIRTVSGSVEVSCSLGLGDAVIDLVETGETMRAQGLMKLGTVLHSEAMLVSSPSNKHPEIVEKIKKRVMGYLNAQQYVMVTYNIHKNNLEAAVVITPGNRSPNITELAEKGWCAVSAMAEANNVQEKLDQLEALGALDILVLDLKHCRFPIQNIIPS